MNKIPLALVLVATSCVAQSGYLGTALDKTKSANPDIRSNGMVMLARDDSPQARRELIALLRYEDGVIVAAIPKGGTDTIYGEGYAEYASALYDVVAKIVENPQYADGLDALVMFGPEADTQAGKKLTMYGTQIAPYLNKLDSSPAAEFRQIALGLAALVLDYDRTGKIALTADDREVYRAIIRSGLSDKDENNRVTATELAGRLQIRPED